VTPVRSGPRRHEASPGSAFARRERRGEVVASLRPEIELPTREEATKQPAAARSAMEVDGADDEAAEAAASAAAALDDLPPRASAAAAAVVVELLTAAPPADSKVLTDSLADRAAFAEARVARFATAFERAAAASSAAAGSVAAPAPASANGGEEEEDPEGASPGSAPSAAVGVARQTARGVFVGRVVDSGDATPAPAAAAAAAAADAPPPPRLDLHSASLEGSAALSGGRRARLDVSRLRHRWRLFPGQVVAVVGACPAGHTLTASALLPSAPPPRAPAAASMAGGKGGDAEGMRVVVASGPFTAPGDIAFEALGAILALAAGAGERPPSSSPSPSPPSSSSSRPADAVILVGPFVDERHPSVSSGSLGVSFDELFEREVVARIAAWSLAFGGEKRRRRAPPPVVLLPSPRDVAAGALTSAFPARALMLPAGTPENIVSLPNPATFRVGGLVFGATGHDVLRDLSASQAAGGLGDGSGGAGIGGGESASPASSTPAPADAAALPGVAPKDRMAGLAGALLEQGCFYPLYPPARGTMLDARLALGGSESSAPPGSSSSSSSWSPPVLPAYPGLSMPFSPDVLLLPSDLAPFARVATAEAPPALRVDGSGELVLSPSSSASASGLAPPPPPQPGVKAVAVNPGRAITAGGGGGTAAVVILGARKKGETNNGDADDAVSRCRVDIVRL